MRSNRVDAHVLFSFSQMMDVEWQDGANGKMLDCAIMCPAAVQYPKPDQLMNRGNNMVCTYRELHGNVRMDVAGPAALATHVCALAVVAMDGHHCRPRGLGMQ